jgi:hypothetical protein
MIGALVLSDKPVVVNSGSFAEATVQLTNGMEFQWEEM